MKSKAIATRSGTRRSILIFVVLAGLSGGQSCSCRDTQVSIEIVPTEIVSSRQLDRANAKKHIQEIRNYFNGCRKGAPAFAEVMLSWRSKGSFAASKASKGVGQFLRLLYATHPKAVLELSCKLGLLDGMLSKFCGWLAKGWDEIVQLAKKVPFVDLLARLKERIFGSEKWQTVAGIVNGAGGAIYDKHKGLTNLHRSFFERKFQKLVLNPAALQAKLRKVTIAYQKEIDQSDRYMLGHLGGHLQGNDKKTGGRSEAELSKNFQAFLSQNGRPSGLGREIIESMVVTMISKGATSVASALFPSLVIFKALKVLRLAMKTGNYADKHVDFLSGLGIDGLADWLENKHKNAKREQMVAKIHAYLDGLERYVIDSQSSDPKAHSGMTQAKGLRQIFREIGDERYKRRVEFYRKVK